MTNETAGTRETDKAGGASANEAFAALQSRDWERAHGLLEALLARGDSPALDALEALGYCRFKLGLVPEACQAFERLFTLLAEQGENRRGAKTAAYIVALYEMLGAEAACNGWEQRGLRLLEGLEPCVERGYLALCRTGCDIHDPAELQERAELALQLAQTFGDRDLELRARGEKGLALVGQGYVNAGFALLDEVMVSIAAGEIRDDDMRARTICSMLSACERTGDVGRAEYWCRRVEQEPHLQHAVLDTHCRVTHGVVDALRGEWDRAETRLAEAIESSLAIPYHRAVSAGRLAEILIQRGKLEAAAEILKGHEERYEAVPALAYLRFREGKHEQAAALLSAVIRGLGQDSIRVAPMLALLVEVQLLLGDLAAAERSARHLKSLEERSESNEIRAYTRLAQGRIARHRGEPDQAVEEFETALALLIHYERPLLRAQLRLDLARTLADTGAFAAAIVEAEAALATFYRLGMSGEVAATELVLRDLNARTDAATVHGGTATPGETDTLSPREREVARLVAEGLTNREIAEQLVLSVRTVEGHVDRILGKLNFHTRTQLATWYGSRSA